MESIVNLILSTYSDLINIVPPTPFYIHDINVLAHSPEIYKSLLIKKIRHNSDNKSITNTAINCYLSLASYRKNIGDIGIGNSRSIYLHINDEASNKSDINGFLKVLVKHDEFVDDYGVLNIWLCQSIILTFELENRLWNNCDYKPNKSIQPTAFGVG